MIDGVPVGSFDSVEGLIDVLQEDTLSCITLPLIDVFTRGGGGGAEEPGWGDDEPQYDTAGDVQARAAGRALYDADPQRHGYVRHLIHESNIVKRNQFLCFYGVFYRDSEYFNVYALVYSYI